MSIEDNTPTGFLMNWRRSTCYGLVDTDKQQRIEFDIDTLFKNIKNSGIKFFGKYDTKWSSGYENFTFGLSPSLKILEQFYDQLMLIGAGQLFDWDTFWGIKGTGDKIEDQGHLLTEQAINSEGGNQEYPMAFYALWNRTDSFYLADLAERKKSSDEITEVFDAAREAGVITFGRYESHWFNKWKFFTFWLGPSFDVLQNVFDQLEIAGDFLYASPLHRMGWLSEIKKV